MKCPKCKGKTAITNSRENRYGTRRTHKCYNCNYRFSTTEIKTDEYKRIKQYAETLEMLLSDLKTEKGGVE